MDIVCAMSNVSPDDLIPTSQVAGILGVTVKTVSRWAADGKLTPVVKTPGLRGAMLFSRADVEELLAAS